jgi:tRNA-modifying protein YgfZ
MGGDDNRRMNTAKMLSGIARLGYLGCIRVAGPDAAAFLQSQLTNDFTRLERDQARLAGYCSAKGRLLASFIAWKDRDGEYVLACSADLLAATLKRLTMFVLRAKCRLVDASAAFPVFGLVGQTGEELLSDIAVWGKLERDEGYAIRLPNAPGHVLGLWIPHSDAAPSAPVGPILSENEWRWLLLLSGLPMVEAKTVERFVPQMVNFELLGGVDFQKGCYPGQEVVARSQYRGTLKRRMFCFDCDLPATAGQDIYSPADPGQPAGVVVNAAPAPGQDGSTLLAELKLAALDADSLLLGDVSGPRLRRRELPYAVPHPAALLG